MITINLDPIENDFLKTAHFMTIKAPCYEYNYLSPEVSFNGEYDVMTLSPKVQMICTSSKQASATAAASQIEEASQYGVDVRQLVTASLYNENESGIINSLCDIYEKLGRSHYRQRVKLSKWQKFAKKLFKIEFFEWTESINDLIKILFKHGAIIHQSTRRTSPNFWVVSSKIGALLQESTAFQYSSEPTLESALHKIGNINKIEVFVNPKLDRNQVILGVKTKEGMAGVGIFELSRNINIIDSVESSSLSKTSQFILEHRISIEPIGKEVALHNYLTLKFKFEKKPLIRRLLNL